MKTEYFKNLAKSFYYAMKSGSLTRYSDDPFATHLPVLVGICHYYGVKSILEFGSGYKSTLAFLDRRAFPSLQRICSVENYQDWYLNVKSKLPSDERIDYKYHSGEMYKAVEDIDIDSYDLVFIDDSAKSEDRIHTIERVLEKNSRIVVIHDFENSVYRKAAAKYANYYNFTSLLPNTGVVVKSDSSSVLAKINSAILRNRGRFPESDIHSWKECFGNEEVRR